MSTNEIRVPDIGDFKDVPIIEVHVQPGAQINVDDPLITLESDKATMEVPASQAGTVKEVKVKAGDRVSMGDLVVVMEGAGAPGRAAEGTHHRSCRALAGRRPARLRLAVRRLRVGGDPGSGHRRLQGRARSSRSTFSRARRSAPTNR